MIELNKIEDSSREKEPKQKTKKILKTVPTFHVKLTEEQKRAKAIALENQVTIFTGRAGTSKTLLACNIACHLLQTGAVSKIVVTRPMVDVGKTMGFLPGVAMSFTEGKMQPYMAPIIQALYKLKDKVSVDTWIKEEKITIVPIQFVRGLNFEDCVVIIDEAENLTAHELKALTTRICKDAYMLFTSDIAQIDLVDKHQSAGYFFQSIMKLEGVGSFELTENFRSKLALEIMDIIDEQLKEK